MSELNSMVFETVDQTTGFIKTLLSIKDSEQICDINVYPEDVFFVVLWKQVPSEGSYDGRFKFVNENQTIMTEYPLPDNTHIYFEKEEDYKEYLEDWLKKNPYYEKDEYGHWFNTRDR